MLLSHLYQYHINAYVQNLCENRRCEDGLEEIVRNLLSLIPATNYADGDFEFDNSSVWNALRQICDEAILKRIADLISKFHEEQFNIKTVYLSVKGLVDLLEYPYYNIDIVNAIEMVLSGKRNTRSELWKYIEKHALPAAMINFFIIFSGGLITMYLTLYASKMGIANAGMFFSVSSTLPTFPFFQNIILSTSPFITFIVCLDTAPCHNYVCHYVSWSTSSVPHLSNKKM